MPKNINNLTEEEAKELQALEVLEDYTSSNWNKQEFNHFVHAVKNN